MRQVIYPIAAGLSALHAQAPATWDELERSHARVVAIEIRIGDVFDLSKPHEQHWIARAGNVLHIETRQRVIKRELRFKVGDLVRARSIHESERILRTFRFLKDAVIVPEPNGAGGVRAVVKTQDAWTLKPSIGFSQVGGQRSLGFKLKDANFLGFGKDLALSHEKTPERSTDSVAFGDRQFLGTKWALAARYQSLSDGRTRFLSFTRPYRSLETPWSVTASIQEVESTTSQYNLRGTAYEIPSRLSKGLFDASWAVSIRGNRVHRIGGGLDYLRTRFDAFRTLAPGKLPQPDLISRDLRGMHAGWSYFEDSYRIFQDLAGMSHTEDYNLGWELSADAGIYSKELGSDVSAPFVRATARKGWIPGIDSLLLMQSQGAARREPTGWRDAWFSTSFTAYHQGFPSQTQAAYLQVDTTRRAEPEHELYLGGLDGLRGYPNHMFLGDRRWILSLEERWITPRNWLGILQLGFMVYADAGAIHRLDSGRWSRTYANLGGGLRFGDLKSSLGRVVLLTVAYPLVRDPGMNRYQIVIGNIVRF